jgi:hypothetical protein
VPALFVETSLPPVEFPFDGSGSRLVAVKSFSATDGAAVQAWGEAAAKHDAIIAADLHGTILLFNKGAERIYGRRAVDVVGKLPQLTALKHRSTAVTDAGLAGLAESKTLESLLMQDFVITNESGPHLAKLSNLSSLEVFRCQGFGTDGVLMLAGLPLTRLTLRDLPDVGDPALAVLQKLPRLKRLYLHELASVGDGGLRQLAAAKELEVLDIWSLPKMTNASMAVIAALPNLKELSIRETGVTEASVDTIAAMPKLQSLTFKNNGPLSAGNAAKLGRVLPISDGVVLQTHAHRGI